jgi:protein-tyrosine phosphatase
VTQRQWLSFVLRRGKPRPPQIDPQTLIIEPENSTGSRTLQLEGAINFRDLGGYRTADGKRVKWGRVFRAGALNNLTDADLEMLRQMELKYIFDLRTAEEMASAPDRVPVGAVHVPMTVEVERSIARRLIMLVRYYNNLERMLLDGYMRVMIEQNARVFGEVFPVLATEGGLPSVIHCTAGKDRTGIASALLLAALGVPEETIIADYSLSNHHHAYFRDLVSDQMASLMRFGLTLDDVYPVTLANPEAMRMSLRYIREHYGDVQTYLHQRAGVDEVTLAKLRDTLLE